MNQFQGAGEGARGAHSNLCEFHVEKPHCEKIRRHFFRMGALVALAVTGWFYKEFNMGYAHYTLADGREAGYGVEAECDKPGCSKVIDRGMDYLCGENPHVWGSGDGWGCGNYHCGPHQSDHDCPNPECGAYALGGGAYCELPKGHDMPHRDDSDGTFTLTEDDDV